MVLVWVVGLWSSNFAFLLSFFYDFKSILANTGFFIGGGIRCCMSTTFSCWGGCSFSMRLLGFACLLNAVNTCPGKCHTPSLAQLCRVEVVWISIQLG